MGITQNANALERFFLTAPELCRLTEESHTMADSPTATRKERNELAMVALDTKIAFFF